MDLQTALDALADYPVLCAYNANVDAIRRVDADLEAFLGPPGENPNGRLDSRGELAAAIAATMERGSGDERAMADALAALGGAPVLYTYLLSERQRAQFTHADGIRFPVVEDGELDLRPLDDV